MILLEDNCERPDLEESLASPLWRRVIPVAGGTGGCGKSTVAAALALALAKRGLETCAVDLGGPEAALHLALGEPLHRPGLGAFMRGHTPWESVRHETRIPNLTLIPADRLEAPPALAPAERRTALMERLRSLRAQAIVVDVGHGASDLAREILFASPHPLLVSLPDAGPIAACHAILRGGIFDLMARWFPEASLEMPPSAVDGNPVPLSAIFENLKKTHAREAFRFLVALERFTPLLMLNTVRHASELDWLRRLADHSAQRSLVRPVAAGALPVSENPVGDPRIGAVMQRLAESYERRLSGRMMKPAPRPSEGAPRAA